MSRRRSLATFVAVLAVSLCAPAVAEAAPAPRQLELRSFTVDIDPGDSQAPGCDPTRAGSCGYITTVATFTGLDGYARPSETQYSAGNLDGSIEVTRTYGCQDATGNRLHRFDQKVATTEGLTNYRGGGFNIPATGDELTSINYVFLSDRMPGNCPAGTTGTLYKITTGKVRLATVFRVEGFTDGKYKASTHGKWTAGS
jgi:hypothetical protein